MRGESELFSELMNSDLLNVYLSFFSGMSCVLSKKFYIYKEKKVGFETETCVKFEINRILELIIIIQESFFCISFHSPFISPFIYPLHLSVCSPFFFLSFF